MIKKLIILLLTLFYSIVINAQNILSENKEIMVIQNIHSPESRLLKTIYFFRYQSNQSSEKETFLRQEGELLAKKLKRDDLLADLLIAEAQADSRVGNLKHLTLAISEAACILDTLTVVPVYFKKRIGVLYNRIDDTINAKKYLNFPKTRGALTTQLSSLIDLAGEYAVINDQKNLIDLYQRTKNILLPPNDVSLLVNTSILFAQKMFDTKAYSSAFDLLNNLRANPNISNQLQVRILSTIIINSIKLNRTDDLKNYYNKLLSLESWDDLTNQPEFLLARTMYLDFNKYYLSAINTCQPLVDQFKKGNHDETYLQAIIELAHIYSEQLKKDFADFYFALAAGVLNHLPRNIDSYYMYMKYFSEHSKQDLNNIGLGRKLNNDYLQDSVYRQELLNQTKELEYNYKILEDKQQLKLLSQQRDIDKLNFALNKQRFLTIITVLILLLISAFAFSYFLYSKRKHATELFNAEVKTLKQKNHIEVIKALNESREAEAQRIADQLHDEVGSLLSIARLNLSSLENPDTKDPIVTHNQVSTANRILSNVADTIRTMSQSLMPVALKQYGLKLAIEQLIHDINDSKTLSIEHLIKGFDADDKFSDSFRVGLYRIIQELFQNIVKHSNATNGYFQLVEHSDSINLYLEDNGTAMKTLEKENSGVGLKLLRSRVEYYQGNLNIEGMQGKGTIVIIDFPLKFIIQK
ncbi:MAG: ATP-binding protein [Ferruginibacter sp.]